MREDLSPQRQLPRESTDDITTTLAERARSANALFRIETEGANHLREISEGAPVIFLTSHFSDYDMPIAISTIANEWSGNLKVMQASTNERFGSEFSAKIAAFLEGTDDAVPVSFAGKPGEKGRAGVFNPSDYGAMRTVLENGGSMVAAAYFDPKYQDKQWHLPQRGGYGGVYLAQITPNAVIVPVAVDIHSETPFGMGSKDVGQIIKGMRPRTTVRIGEPIKPHAIGHIERFAQIMEKRDAGKELSAEDMAEFTRIRRELRAESDRVMQSLSEMLPPEKRAAEGA